MMSKTSRQKEGEIRKKLARHRGRMKRNNVMNVVCSADLMAKKMLILMLKRKGV